MAGWKLRLTAVLVVVLLVSGAGVSRAQKQAAETSPVETSAAKKLREAKLKFFHDRLRDHRLASVEQADQPFQFVKTPVMQFENPISRISEGYAFLWTDRGRPAVMLKSYFNNRGDRWGRTFVSLSDRRIDMHIGDRRTWFPEKPALEFQPLKEAPPPAKQARLRLVQMRNIAGRFQVIDRWGKENPADWKLRLLTTPLYRYKVADDKVVDAALFGYVLTTSPEALLLLEARETEDGLQWWYAVSRCTVFEIRFSLDDAKLAEFPRLKSWPPTGNYFHIAQDMPDYPFKK